MKISALRLFNVRRFADSGVAIENIGDGVNVLSAANEHGKSTSFEALHALFFQPHGSLANEVKSLKPYAGGNPLVEADVATAEGRYRITKQFLGGRSARVVDRDTGRLIAQADEAEAFIAGLVGGRMAGPAGLLWVRQGVTGIERRAKSDEDSERQARLSLVESVQGEVEAVTGGRRMAAIMAAVESELGALLTPTGRPKKDERYHSAILQRDELLQRERDLAAEVASLRAALDERAARARLLADLEQPEEQADRRQRIAKAEETVELARRQEGAVRLAAAELAAARERRDRAAEALALYRQALAAAKALEPRSAAAEAARAAADGRREAVEAAIAAAQRELGAAEAAERAARDVLAALERAERAGLAAERQEGLERRLTAAEALRQAVEESEAALALLKVPAKSLTDLTALDLEIAGLEAVRLAGRPSVTVAYETAPTGIIVMDGRPLAGDERRSFQGQAELAIPGIGRLTLRAAEGAGDDERLGRKIAERAALLQRLGVADHAEAQARRLAAAEREAGLSEQKQRLVDLAPAGLPALRAEAAAGRAASLAVERPEGDAAALRAAHAAAGQRLDAARLALKAAEAERAPVHAALLEAEKAAARLAADRVHQDAILGAETERPGREARLVEALAAREAMFAAAEREMARLQAAAVDLASAEAALERARSVAKAAEMQAARLKEEIAGLSGQIKALSEEAVEESWRESIDALAAAHARVAAFESEVAALTRLKAALDAARASARDLYLKPVMAELKPLLGLLFDDVSITFNETTLLPQRILRRGQEEDIERLSGGMREQLSVLTRLAFARLLARGGRPAPVILDDALVYSDDDRIEKMFDALHRQARDQQIIVFSCRQRAFQRLGGTVLTMTDWTPG